MSPKTLTALAAFATLSAAPALAEPADAPAPPADQPMPSDTASTMPPQTPVTILQSSPTPADQAYKLVAGAPNTISNQPIPDTAQNRAKYGGPMSNSGRKTAPRGN